VLGGTGAGKTTIVQTLLYREGGAGTSGGTAAPEPTTSLDYRFLRRVVSGGNRKLAHVWELGGGRSLVRLLDIAINLSTVEKTGIVVVADLSRPAETLVDLEFWLSAALRRVKEVLEKITRRPKLPAILEARAQARLGETHRDAASLSGRLSPVPVLIVANKFDKLKNDGLENLKVAARTLRAIAHCAGASLVYVDKSDGTTRQALLAHLSQLQQHQRGELKNKIRDHDSKSVARRGAPVLKIRDIEALSVAIGQDSLRDIGVSSVLPTVSTQTLLDEWKSKFKARFKLSKGNEGKGTAPSDVKLAPEPAVDSILTQVNAQAKQKERAAALARKMAPQGGGGGRGSRRRPPGS